jgi:coenzyme F420-reducing hydrogenase delta subunit
MKGTSVASESSDVFEPKIAAYCCQYCAYAAADLAGNLRLQYPPNVRIILLPCTGRVDALNILRAFEEGADGVYVAGCRPGECHFLAGNLNAARRVRYAKGLLDQIGMGGDRVEMYNLSSAEAQRFAEIAVEMTERIRRLGPNPLRRIGGVKKDRQGGYHGREDR